MPQQPPKRSVFREILNILVLVVGMILMAYTLRYIEERENESRKRKAGDLQWIQMEENSKIRQGPQ